MKPPPYVIEHIGETGPWKPTGIDVEKLTKAADAMVALSRAEELHQMAVAARDAALKRKRMAYRKKWQSFFECELCGNRDFKGGARCAKCDGTFVNHERDL